MSYMSLMQRPSGSSCSSRVCEMRPQLPRSPVCWLPTKARPTVPTRAPSRVVACGSPRDEAGSDDDNDDDCATILADEAISEWRLSRLPHERARLQAALLKAPFQLVGGAGVWLWAFGDFGHSSGHLTLNPLFPTGIPGLVVLMYSYAAMIGAFVGPLFTYIWWKDCKSQCVKDWDRGLVDHILTSHKHTSKNDRVDESLSKGQHPLCSEQRERVEDLVRQDLLESLPQKHEDLDDKVTWGVLKIIGTFVVYKGIVEEHSPYHLAWLHFNPIGFSGDSPEWFSLVVYTIIVITPLDVVGDVLDAFINLKLHEQNCVARCGKESIKS